MLRSNHARMRPLPDARPKNGGKEGMVSSTARGVTTVVHSNALHQCTRTTPRHAQKRSSAAGSDSVARSRMPTRCSTRRPLPPAGPSGG